MLVIEGCGEESMLWSTYSRMLTQEVLHILVICPSCCYRIHEFVIVVLVFLIEFVGYVSDNPHVLCDRVCCQFQLWDFFLPFKCSYICEFKQMMVQICTA